MACKSTMQLQVIVYVRQSLPSLQPHALVQYYIYYSYVRVCPRLQVRLNCGYFCCTIFYYLAQDRRYIIFYYIMFLGDLSTNSSLLNFPPAFSFKALGTFPFRIHATFHEKRKELSLFYSRNFYTRNDRLSKYNTCIVFYTWLAWI